MITQQGPDEEVHGLYLSSPSTFIRSLRFLSVRVSPILRLAFFHSVALAFAGSHSTSPSARPLVRPELSMRLCPTARPFICSHAQPVRFRLAISPLAFGINLGNRLGQFNSCPRPTGIASAPLHLVDLPPSFMG